MKTDSKNIVCWFSCGAASAVAAWMVLQKHRQHHNVEIVYNPVANEHPDNLRFKYDIEKRFGTTILEAKNPLYPNANIEEVFDARKVMSTVHGYAPCTEELKKKARYEYEKTHDIDFHVMGFTADESRRHDRFVMYERSNVWPVLINAKVTKRMCFDILKYLNVAIPLTYYQGIPNANCIGCVKSSSPTYWNLIRKFYPEVFDRRCEQSRRLGCRLVVRKGERIFLDELKKTDKGGVLATYECGIWCDKY